MVQYGEEYGFFECENGSFTQNNIPIKSFQGVSIDEKKALEESKLILDTVLSDLEKLT